MPWARCRVESLDATGGAGVAAASTVIESSPGGQIFLPVEVGRSSVAIYRLSAPD